MQECYNENDYNLSMLEPGCDENPYDTEAPKYNPFNHVYPIFIDTKIGTLEVMVQFSVVRGAYDLGYYVGKMEEAFRIPINVEEMNISEFAINASETLQITEPEDVMSQKDLAYENAPLYMVPMVVRARRLTKGENAPEAWELLSKEETASIIDGPTLEKMIVGYAKKVMADQSAPAILSEILEHFASRYNEVDEDED